MTHKSRCSSSFSQGNTISLVLTWLLYHATTILKVTVLYLVALCPNNWKVTSSGWNLLLLSVSVSSKFRDSKTTFNRHHCHPDCRRNGHSMFFFCFFLLFCSATTQGGIFIYPSKAESHSPCTPLSVCKTRLELRAGASQSCTTSFF